MTRRESYGWLRPSPGRSATVLLVVLWGIPTSHDLLFVWLGLGMAALLARRVARVVRDWLPLVAVLFIYDLLRGVADGLLVNARETPQIRVEAALFGRRSRRCGCRSISGTAPNHLHWWDYATWFLYLTHFFVDVHRRGGALDLRARPVRARTRRWSACSR